MSPDRQFHRPAPKPDLDGFDTHPGPAEQTQMAHELAHMIIADADRERDDASARRFVELADEYGIERIAELWSSAPAVSLPGALWRLYALRSWIRRRPEESTDWFRRGVAGEDTATTAEAVAGIPYLPTPDELAQVVDEILLGAFRGDFALALERASAFVHVAARGRAEAGHSGSVAGLRSFSQMSEDFRTAAAEYRAGTLQ